MFVVSRCVETDLAHVADLHVRSWQTAYRDFVPAQILETRTQEKVLSGWRSTFAKFPENISVARSGEGVVVGFSCAGPVTDLTHSGLYDYEVYGLHIDPNFHGRGIGSLLLHDAFQRMRGLGLKTAIIWTLEKNKQARRFYEKHGGIIVKEGMWTEGAHSQAEIAYGWTTLNRRLCDCAASITPAAH